ncbi:MAG: transposase [Patiriisocius sp.]|jgi:transposase
MSACADLESLRIAQLEKDNARLSRKLDIANDCLHLQKKAFTILDHLNNGFEQ